MGARVVLAGFSFSPSTQASITTVLWIDSRSHPAVGALVLLPLLTKWMGRDD
jgi:hypothetical protein